MPDEPDYAKISAFVAYRRAVALEVHNREVTRRPELAAFQQKKIDALEKEYPDFSAALIRHNEWKKGTTK